MATDKAINVRQLKATQELAATLAEIERRLAGIEAGLAEIKAALAASSMSRPSSPTQAARKAG
ncbi:MAG: hypothetical protein BroJett011_62740 [Chloroflexota bacterium]|nr:MAG: hypothetical protein BroJett011_62740 [Chloroflexota bacterium]